MGYLGALAPFIAIWAISRSNLTVPNGVRTVPVMAKGNQLTAGGVGDNGEVIQPTYEEVRVRVEAPLTTLVYQTPVVIQNGIRYKYGVVKHEGFDDGRRTYEYNGGAKNSKVFPETVDGFYAVEWTSVQSASSRAYNETGIKGWYYRMSNRPLTLEEQTAYADMLYEDRVDRANPEPSEPSEPEPTPPEQIDPDLNPDLGDLVGGGLGGVAFSETDQVDTEVDLEEVEIEVIGEPEEETVVVAEEETLPELDLDTLPIYGDNKGSLLGGNNFKGGFNV